MADLVIGSGPSGFAVAEALLARGREVVMLDGGRDIESGRAALRDRLAARPPGDWTTADRAAWREPQYATPAGQVRRYGSDFAMEPADATYAEGADAFQLRASRAVGGLSNLWGSAVLPYREADLAGWPVGAADLAPHYRAVAEFLPVAGRPDDLEALFPSLPMAGRTPLPPAPQAETLLARLSRAADGLAHLGLTAGQARQAVAPGCRQCGMCLHGCPWGLIWSARTALDRLRAWPGFTYRPGVAVRAFAETGDGVSLMLESGGTLTGDRAFLAAGVLETARIVLVSLPDLGSITLADSAHGFLPALHLWPAPRRPDRPPFHTLTQAFLELDAASVSPFLVHAQIYAWNEFFERDLIGSYGRKLPGSAPFWRALARRLIVAQIFLHSDHSARVRLSLARDGRLAARLEANPATGAVFAAATGRIGSGLRLAGLLPLGFARRLNPPGSSFHAGATLPMSANPHGAQTDSLGRPAGLSRLHIVDASVLPAIPATTITFPVMANAHRIGSLVT